MNDPSLLSPPIRRIIAQIRGERKRGGEEEKRKRGGERERGAGISPDP